MKRWQKGIIIFIVFLIVALGIMSVLFPIEEEKEVHQNHEQINFVAPISDSSIVYIENDEAQWMWQASHGVLDEFVDNYDGSIVSKEEWLTLTEQQREELLLNGQ